MLEAVADAGMLDGCGTAIILQVEGKWRLLAQLELTRYLPVGSSGTVSKVVDIGKHKRAAPLVGLEHLDGGGDAGTS